MAEDSQLVIYLEDLPETWMSINCMFKLQAQLCKILELSLIVRMLLLVIQW